MCPSEFRSASLCRPTLLLVVVLSLGGCSKGCTKQDVATRDDKTVSGGADQPAKLGEGSELIPRPEQKPPSPSEVVPGPDFTGDDQSRTAPKLASQVGQFPGADTAREEMPSPTSQPFEPQLTPRDPFSTPKSGTDDSFPWAPEREPGPSEAGQRAPLPEFPFEFESPPAQRPPAELRPEPQPQPEMPQPSQLREWVDRSGRFRVSASFVALDGRTVKLRKADGKTVRIQWERLSELDRGYVTADSSGSAQQAPSRVWSDRSGRHTLTAHFVSLQDGRVQLKNVNGKMARIRLERLGDFDRGYVAAKTGVEIPRTRSYRLMPNPCLW